MLRPIDICYLNSKQIRHTHFTHRKRQDIEKKHNLYLIFLTFDCKISYKRLFKVEFLVSFGLFGDHVIHEISTKEYRLTKQTKRGKLKREKYSAQNCSIYREISIASQCMK